MDAFEDLLSRSGLSKAELARRLGLDPTTPSKWGGSPPKYALAYLGLYVEIREFCRRVQ